MMRTQAHIRHAIGVCCLWHWTSPIPQYTHSYVWWSISVTRRSIRPTIQPVLSFMRSSGTCLLRVQACALRAPGKRSLAWNWCFLSGSCPCKFGYFDFSRFLAQQLSKTPGHTQFLLAGLKHLGSLELFTMGLKQMADELLLLLRGSELFGVLDILCACLQHPKIDCVVCLNALCDMIDHAGEIPVSMMWHKGSMLLSTLHTMLCDGVVTNEFFPLLTLLRKICGKYPDVEVRDRAATLLRVMESIDQVQVRSIMSTNTEDAGVGPARAFANGVSSDRSSYGEATPLLFHLRHSFCASNRCIKVELPFLQQEGQSDEELLLAYKQTLMKSETHRELHLNSRFGLLRAEGFPYTTVHSLCFTFLCPTRSILPLPPARLPFAHLEENGNSAEWTYPLHVDLSIHPTLPTPIHLRAHVSYSITSGETFSCASVEEIVVTFMDLFTRLDIFRGSDEATVLVTTRAVFEALWESPLCR